MTERIHIHVADIDLFAAVLMAAPRGQRMDLARETLARAQIGWEKYVANGRRQSILGWPHIFQAVLNEMPRDKRPVFFDMEFAHCTEIAANAISNFLGATDDEIDRATAHIRAVATAAE